MERVVHGHELSYEMKWVCCDECGWGEVKQGEGSPQEIALTCWKSNIIWWKKQPFHWYLKNLCFGALVYFRKRDFLELWLIHSVMKTRKDMKLKMKVKAESWKVPSVGCRSPERIWMSRHEPCLYVSITWGTFKNIAMLGTTLRHLLMISIGAQASICFFKRPRKL